MRNIQVCHDEGTLFIDRDGTTVLLEVRVYHYLSLLRLGLVWFDFCFTALKHILGHFGRSQLT